MHARDFKKLFRSVDVQNAPRRSSWLLSLTAICFLCGSLSALQVRAVQQSQNAHINRAEQESQRQTSYKQALHKIARLQQQAQIEKTARLKMAAQLSDIKNNIRLNYVPKTNVLPLKSEIQHLKRLASLTEMQGEGVIITLSDNRKAHFDGVHYSPEMVHDFDLQQTVHELLLIKAKAIAIKGAGGVPIRITNYTPIRCVGPAILIDFQPVVAPYEIWAVGNSTKLANALEMPGGIRDRARNDGLLMEVNKAKNLKLPATQDSF